MPRKSFRSLTNLHITIINFFLYVNHVYDGFCSSQTSWPICKRIGHHLAAQVAMALGPSHMNGKNIGLAQNLNLTSMNTLKQLSI